MTPFSLSTCKICLVAPLGPSSNVSYVLFVALGRHAGARNNAIGGGHNLAAILRLARLLTNPHLGAALDTPRLHILDSTRALDLELGLDKS